MKTTFSEDNEIVIFHDIKNTMSGVNPDKILPKRD